MLGQAQSLGLDRVPMYKPRKEQSTRIEFRSPDPACNPYLAFSVILAAGLKGIDEGYELPPEATDNIYEMHENGASGPRHRASARRSLRGTARDGALRVRR